MLVFVFALLNWQFAIGAKDSAVCECLANPVRQGRYVIRIVRATLLGSTLIRKVLRSHVSIILNLVDSKTFRDY